MKEIPKIHYLMALLLLLLSYSSTASQYRSRELAPPSQEQLMASQLSIADLEKSLNSQQDAYSKASTARFLARHFLQEKDYNKAATYYRESLQDDGLSPYAKQDVLAELAQLYMLQQQYAGALAAIEQRQQLGGQENSTLLLIQGMAWYYTGQYNKAVAAADKVQALEHNPDPLLLKQLLFIYFNSKAYAQAAAVQQRYLEKMPQDLQGWRQLSAIYLKQDKQTKAADTLALAWRNGLPLEARDLVQLAELYAINRNPFAAGRVFEQAMQQGILAASPDNLDKQFRYWLLARERDRAIKTLQQALQQQPDIERYLQLAQLQMEEQQWPAMKQSVLNACAIALPDEYVGRANLLLGISELNMQQYAAARSALINATLIGGAMDEAAAWLRYMDAEQIAAEEQEMFSGACTPKWARASRRQLAVAVARSEQQQPTVKAVQYTIKTTAPQTLFVGSYTVPVVELEQKILPLAMQLGMAVSKNRGRINGPMQFIFPEPVLPGAEVIRFQMAFPISKAPDVTGRYQVVQDTGFKAASMLFNDQPQNLPAAWAKLYEQVTADGHSATGVGRQVILEPGKDTIKMELLLGVK